MALDPHEHVAVAEVLIILRPHALLLLADVAPEFVTFHVSHLDVANPFGHDPLALLTSEHQKLQNRGVVNFGGSFDAGHAVTFEQQPQNHLGFLHGQVHAVQVILARLQERLGALAALIALATLTVAALALTFDPAGMAGHRNLRLRFAA